MIPRSRLPGGLNPLGRRRRDFKPPNKAWFSVKTRIEHISNEEGQALVEYALILALVTLFALTTLQLAAGTMVDLINYVSSTIAGVT